MGFKIIHAAEDQRHPGKQYLPVLADKGKCVVVGDNDDVEMFVLVFFLVQSEEHACDVFIIVSLGVHVLDLQINFVLTLVQNRPHAFQNGVRPPVAVVIGIQVEDGFFGFFRSGLCSAIGRSR